MRSGQAQLVLSTSGCQVYQAPGGIPGIFASIILQFATYQIKVLALGMRF